MLKAIERRENAMKCVRSRVRNSFVFSVIWMLYEKEMCPFSLGFSLWSMQCIEMSPDYRF